MALANILIDTAVLAAADVTSIIRPDAGGDNESVRRIAKFLDGVAIGSFPADLRCSIGGAKAVGLVTFTDNPTADDTLGIANVTITVKDGDAAGEDEFDLVDDAGSAALDAAANAVLLAALINAHSTLSTQFVATSALGVVTVTCRYPGTLGNGIELVDDLTNGTITAFTGGTNGTETELEVA